MNDWVRGTQRPDSVMTVGSHTASWQRTGQIVLPDDPDVPFMDPANGQTAGMKVPSVPQTEPGVRTGTLNGPIRTPEEAAFQVINASRTANWQRTGSTNPLETRQRTGGYPVRPDSGTRDETPDSRHMGPDPFDEPVVSPELEEVRSPDLYDHSSEFWKNEGAGNETGVHAVPGDKAGFASDGEEHRIRNSVIAAAALAAILLAAALLLFRVREIRVVGNEAIPAETVIACSGIGNHSNLLFLNEKKIENGVNGNRYLRFVCVEREWPSTLTLRIKERTPAACMTYCGIRYVLDRNLMVLEEQHEIEGNGENLIELKGIHPRSLSLGAKMSTMDPAQALTCQELMREIRVLSLKDMIREIDLSDTQNLYMLNTNGMSVSLGDISDIHAKLRAMKLTCEELVRRGYTEGSINVSTPDAPTYVPSET